LHRGFTNRFNFFARFRDHIVKCIPHGGKATTSTTKRKSANCTCGNRDK
jgi:hypothetical protein